MSDDEDFGNGMFQEPDDFLPPEKPATFATHTMKNGQKIEVRLVGFNPLWGHLLWNAGRVISDYLESNSPQLLRGKTVLEVGAGAGLPSLVSAILGARAVVVSDYPDADLVENLRYNVSMAPAVVQEIVKVEGYLWGSPVDSLMAHLPSPNEEGFDLLILADLLFNHSEHAKLVKTVRDSLRRSRDSKALVFFTPYRPWLLEKDLAFFPLAESEGFKVEKLFEKVLEKVLFENDPGDELLRRTVFAYQITWADI